MTVYDPSPDALDGFVGEITGAHACDSNPAAVGDAQVVVLAVKPQHVPCVAEELRRAIRPDHLLVSLVAGVSLERLSAWFATQRLVRVMPNTPCLVGQGASAFAIGSAVTEEDAQWVHGMMSSLGMAFQVDESLMDAVTGLSGSGPAYVYLLIEALSDGGVRAGLPRSMATALAAQTVRGAAEMVLRSGEHPAVLKDRVASPGGTTMAGLQVLEDRAVRSAVIAAVLAAAERSAQMGRSARESER